MRPVHWLPSLVVHWHSSPSFTEPGRCLKHLIDQCEKWFAFDLCTREVLVTAMS